RTTVAEHDVKVVGDLAGVADVVIHAGLDLGGRTVPGRPCRRPERSQREQGQEQDPHRSQYTCAGQAAAGRNATSSRGRRSASAAQSPAPGKIGVTQPLSGSVAASGNYVRMGAEIARDWINARGGVLGRKVELLIEDNKSDPKEAASAAEKLIVRDKVPAIMGAWGSSMTLAAMLKLEEYGVPMVVETSSAASITKRGNPWIFRISPLSEMEALGLEQYVDKLGVKRVDF